MRLLVLSFTLLAAFGAGGVERAKPKVSPSKTHSKKMAVKVAPPLAPLPPPLPVMTPPPVAKLSFAKDAPASAKPYWKSRPALMKRMLDERYITVSVKRDDLPNGRVVFTMAGAGDVNRDKDASFKLAQDYPKLKEISSHFKTVSFEDKSQKLFIVTEALGYEARMLMQLTPVTEDWRSEVQWEVIWGSFKGMKGVIGFERLGARATEVSFQGRFEANELPMPRFLMGFALEVVVQKVAEKMRTYLEEHIP
jgi:ribosome-associated toxin RatA of RatAB toxin-antitoxin module